ncbi:MAG: DUF4105 domain-containing protein [Polyangiales bacterium]
MKSRLALLWWLLLAGLWPAARSAAQPLPAGDKLSISVVTFGRGDRVHQYFGHNAIVVAGAGVTRPTVFNYGMFTFGDGMVRQFLTGRLQFWVGASDLERTSAAYAAANRDVRLLELNLTPVQRRVILDKVMHDARPENRVYLYDHYFDNCSTRVRDVLDLALGGQLKRAFDKPAPFTLRDETRRYTQHDLLTEWTMMLALNGSVDRPQKQWGDAFLPLELEAMLKRMSVTDEHGELVPLVASDHTVFSARRAAVPEQPPRRWPQALALGLVIALGLGALGLAARSGRGPWRVLLLTLTALYGVLGGVLGSLLAYLAMFSDHLVAHYNVNLLLVNPLGLLGGLSALAALSRARWAGRLLRGTWAALAVAAIALVVIKVLPLGVAQDVSLTATLLVPLQVGLWWALSGVP